ncbi:MAG: methyltransferase domain-containing protein [Pseudomonadota bacterium]
MKTIQTRGRTLDIAAPIYDFTEPLVLFGKQKQINLLLLELLDIKAEHRILDIGCGTGLVAELISKKLNADSGAMAVGIDAASKMIAAARKKRQSETCKFEIMAGENLLFEDESFDSVVSSFFFHHIDLDLKKRTLDESFRVLKPGGRLVIADMHIPTNLLGAMTSYFARWMFMQPEIGENIRGVLPGLIEESGFAKPELINTFLGYVAVFSSRKP